MSLSKYGKTNYEVKVPISYEYAREVAVSASNAQPDISTQYRYKGTSRRRTCSRGWTRRP